MTKASRAFLRYHGLITIGENLRIAADATLAVDHTIKILLACKITGAEPSLIPQDAVKLSSYLNSAI